MKTDAEYKVVIIDPKNTSQFNLLTIVHYAECDLMNDIMAEEKLYENDNRRPVMVNLDLGPEKDVEDKVLKHSVKLPDLKTAYSEVIKAGCPFTFRLNLDIITYMKYIMKLDETFIHNYLFTIPTGIQSNHTDKIVVFLREKQYYGHAWYFTDSNYPELCGIHDIRSSLVNILVGESCFHDIKSLEHRRYIPIRLMIGGIIPLALKEGRKKLLVPWPMQLMIPTLRELGFSRVDASENNAETQFLGGIFMTPSYFAFNLQARSGI